MFHYLRERNVYDRIFSFVLQTRVFFLFFLKYYLKYLSLTPCITKRNHVLKYHLIFFFCNFIIDFFLFGICSTKGAALRKEPHKTSVDRGQVSLPYRRTLLTKVLNTFPRFTRDILESIFKIPVLK